MEKKVLGPAKPQDLEQLEAQIQFTNMMSQSLLFSLERQYLDIPFEKATYIQPVMSGGLSVEGPSFLRLKQVGNAASGSLYQPFTAFQTALSACHKPGCYSLLFIVSSDGDENHIYLGTRSHDRYAYNSEDFVNYLGYFLQGNWPGTRFQLCDQDEQIFQDQILSPLNHKLNFAAALTGIPSLKPGDNPGYPQSLDRLLRGLRGSPFMYMVVAEPMSQVGANEIIYQGRDLLGRVHTLTKTTFTETSTTGTSKNVTITDVWSKTKTESKTKQAEMSFAMGLLAASIATIFPPAGFFSSLTLGGAKLLTSSFSMSKETSTAETVGKNIEKSIGYSESSAQAFGREYINAHARAAETLLQQYIARFEQARSSGCWNVGVYFLAPKPDIVQQGVTQLRALLSGEKSSFEPIRIHDLKRVWVSGTEKTPENTRDALRNFEQPNLMLVHPKTQELLKHPLGSAFNGLTTPLNTEELALLVNLPRREVSGIQVIPTADFSLNPPKIQEHCVKLGDLLEGGEATSLSYNISLRTLAKHTLVTGIIGSGKTTTCCKLLSELLQLGTPFLVIEPAKDEYVKWAMDLNEGLTNDVSKPITIYMPGVQSWRGHKLEHELKLNPLDIVWLEGMRPDVLSHLDRLKSIFIAMSLMQEALPVLLEDVLIYTYNRPHRNWLAEEFPPYGTHLPTLEEMYNHISVVIKGKGYNPHITANLTTALKTRIYSLRQGWKKLLFDQTHSTKWADIFDRPVVINLSHLGDDADKAFTMAILMLFLYEYRQAQYESGKLTQPLQHITVIEESHRILMRPTRSALGQANPQAKVAEMFANILSEIRVYGEGMILVDQVPSRLIPDAVKNTNLKIVHRLVASDDRDATASYMTLTNEQAAIIKRLRPGQAIIFGDQDDMPAWVQIKHK